MSRYIFTEQAAQDLEDIWDYVAADSLDAADIVARDIRAALELIAAMPGVGHRRKDVRNPRYRFWRANRFIIAYFPDTRPLQIIRIVGAQRDVRRLFDES